MVDHLPPALEHLGRRDLEQLFFAAEVVVERPNPMSALSVIS